LVQFRHPLGTFWVSSRRQGEDLVKRLLAPLIGLIALPLVAEAPPARALGAGVCTITGTINFDPQKPPSAEGAWSIGPAAISCHGLSKGPERFLGQGPFSGSGSYSVLPTGTGGCLHQVGTGTVEYTVPTSGNPLHVKEAHQFVLAGAGGFTTPSLRGSFQQTPPFEGDCVVTPVTRATFVAQAVLVRDVPIYPSEDGKR
jgi:hypothetical protein